MIPCFNKRIKNLYLYACNFERHSWGLYFVVVLYCLWQDPIVNSITTSLNVVLLLVTMICILYEIVYLQKPPAALLHVNLDKWSVLYLLGFEHPKWLELDACGGCLCYM
jgi:hypothetical protein